MKCSVPYCGATLNAKADSLTWVTPVVATERIDFDEISRGVSQHAASYEKRWNTYRNNVTAALAPANVAPGNPYDSQRGALGRLGLSTTAAAGYERQFGLSLSARQIVPIGGSSHLLAQTAPLGP